VSEPIAEEYALKNGMAFFEVSRLCDFNVTESLAALSRVALKRNGMSRSLGLNKGKMTFTECLLMVMLIVMLIVIGISARSLIIVQSYSNRRVIIVHSFIPGISIAPLEVRYYSEALPTQHGYCV